MSTAKNTNYMLLKATLTDGHYISEDLLMVECRTDIPTPTPSPTAFSAPSPTPTPTPTATPSNIIELTPNNNWTYIIQDFLIARFVPTDNQISYFIRIPPLASNDTPVIGGPAPLPVSASVFIGDQKIGDILFISPYLTKTIVLLVNANTYNSTMNIGQIIF